MKDDGEWRKEGNRGDKESGEKDADANKGRRRREESKRGERKVPIVTRAPRKGATAGRMEVMAGKRMFLEMTATEGVTRLS